MQEFFTILSNFGFPVAVASYLLFRFEKKLEDLTQTNNKLVIEVESLKAINDDLLKDIKRVQSKIDQLEKIIIGLKKRL
jgi:peptidoglycan hydrolase CwlO-like protein